MHASKDPRISSTPDEETAARAAAGGLNLLPEAAIVALAGDLDRADIGDLATLLDEAHEAGRPITILDMAEVSFLDSAIMQLMIDNHARAEAAGRPLLICDLHGHPLEMIRLAGLHLTLHLFDTSPE